MIAYPRPSSVDSQIEDIRKALREVHRTLYKWHKATENVTGAVHSPLSEVDAAMNGVRSEVSNIRNTFSDTIGKFPSHFVWLSLLLLLDLLIWALAFFLIVKIAEGMREIGRRMRILRGENGQKIVQEGKETQKNTKKTIGKCHGQWSEGANGQTEEGKIGKTKTTVTPTRRNSQFGGEEREKEDEIRMALLPKKTQQQIY